MRAFMLFWIGLLAPGLSAEGQAKPCPKAEHVAVEASATQSELLKVEVDTMGMDASLPMSSMKLLRFKDLLVRTSDAMIQCATADNRSVDPKEFEQTLSHLLDANKPEPPAKVLTGSEPDTMPGVLGSSLKVSVKRPNGLANVITVELQFDIVCGYDTVLLAYEQRDSGWQRVLRWQRGRYDSPEKAFGDFFSYAVLPDSKGAGGWRMIVAHGRPWCTSRFSGFNIDLLQPRRGQIQQRTVWHYDGEYSRFDTDPHIEIKPDGFELRVPIVSFDPNVFTLPGVFRFRVSGDLVQREQPVAVNGRDFVNVWLDIDWGDARRWSETADRDDLKSVHEAFAVRDADTKNITTYRYGPVLACSDKQHFQVEIDASPLSGPHVRAITPMFYQIRQEQNSFTMLSASSKADARCRGHGLMAKQ